MIAVKNEHDLTPAYPEIVPGMPVDERRKVLEKLKTSLPGYIWNREFVHKNAAKKILTVPEDLPENKVRRKPSGSSELSRYFGMTARLPLLTAAQEVFYFRRMNFLRWRAEVAVNRIDANRPQLKLLRQIVADLKQADADRNFLTEHNLRLVIPLAHRYCPDSESVWEYVSEGNAALLRAIHGFDYGRGFRFSTYATWAIVNSLQRLVGKEHRNAQRFVCTEDIVFDGLESELESESAEELRESFARNQIGELMSLLDQRSRTVVAMRFGLGEFEQSMTLAEIGDHFGVSKERIRQIEQKALRTMSRAASQNQLRA